MRVQAARLEAARLEASATKRAGTMKRSGATAGTETNRLGRARGSLRVVLVLVLAAVAVPACGDDNSGSDDPTTTAVSLEAWASAVDDICGQARADVEALDKPGTAEQVATWLGIQLDILDRQADRVDALGVPTGYEDQVEEFVGTYRDLVDLAEETLELTTEGATPLAEDRLARLQSDLAAMQASAGSLRSELGITNCDAELLGHRARRLPARPSPPRCPQGIQARSPPAGSAGQG